jgi:hypothetical protein
MATFLWIDREKKDSVAINLDAIQRIEFVTRDGVQRAQFYDSMAAEHFWPYNGLEVTDELRKAIEKHLA